MMVNEEGQVKLPTLSIAATGGVGNPIDVILMG